MAASGLLEIHTLHAYIHTLCDTAGLTAKFVDDDGSGPWTDGKIIVIPKFWTNITKEDIAKLRYFVLHECLHHIEGPGVFKIAEENALNNHSPLMAIHNILEDERIEREGSKRYIGDRAIIDEGCDITLTNMHHAVSTGTKELDEDVCKIAATMLCSMQQKSTWSPATDKHYPSLIEAFGKRAPLALKYLKDLEDKSIPQKMGALKNEYEAFELAQDIFDILFAPKTAKEHIEELKQAAAASGGKGDKEGTPNEGVGQKGDGEEEGASKYAPYVPSQHTYDAKVGDGNGVRFTYTDADMYGAYQAAGPKDFQLLTQGSSSTNNFPLNERGTRGFANAVRRLLMVKSQAYYLGGQKKGKVCSKNLFRACVPQQGNGDWNSKVFKKKIEDDMLDVAVSVLVDWSGSMGGDKARHAATGAALLNDSLSRVLRIPLEILGFTTGSGHGKVAILDIKDFNKLVPSDKILERFSSHYGNMGGTPDADSIMFAYNRLIQRKEKRKVLVVLSDGSPASNRQGNAAAYLKTLVETIDKEGRVFIFGIGIEDDNVKKFYPKNIVINNSDELERAMLSVISNYIVRGK